MKFYRLLTEGWVSFKYDGSRTRTRTLKVIDTSRVPTNKQQNKVLTFTVSISCCIVSTWINNIPVTNNQWRDHAHLDRKCAPLRTIAAAFSHSLPRTSLLPLLELCPPGNKNDTKRRIEKHLELFIGVLCLNIPEKTHTRARTHTHVRYVTLFWPLVSISSGSFRLL